MEIEDIKNNPAMMMRLRWDLTAEKLTSSKDDFSSKNAGYYFGIHVKGNHKFDRDINLFLIHIYPDGGVINYPMEGIPEDMIFRELRVTSFMYEGTELNITRETNVRKGKYYFIDRPLINFLKKEIGVR